MIGTEGKLTLSPRLKFKDAAAFWRRALDEQDLKPGSRVTYKQQLNALERFFGTMKLAEISVDQLANYQKFRLSAAGGRIAPLQINHEIQKLGQILDLAGLWHSLKPVRPPKSSAGRYRPLPAYRRKATSKRLNHERRQRRAQAWRTFKQFLAKPSMIAHGSINEFEKTVRTIVTLSCPSRKFADQVREIIAQAQGSIEQQSELGRLEILRQDVLSVASRRYSTRAPYMKRYRAKPANKKRIKASKRLWNAKNRPALRKRRRRT
jgi:hypothetical protein